MRLINTTTAAAVIKFPTSDFAALKHDLDAAHCALSLARDQQIVWGIGGMFFGVLIMSITPFFLH